MIFNNEPYLNVLLILYKWFTVLHKIKSKSLKLNISYWENYERIVMKSAARTLIKRLICAGGQLRYFAVFRDYLNIGRNLPEFLIQSSRIPFPKYRSLNYFPYTIVYLKLFFPHLILFAFFYQGLVSLLSQWFLNGDKHCQN